MTRVAVFDSTIQKTREWLRDIKEELGVADDQAAYAALRATLHTLRDCLSTDQAALLGAQLAMLVRGLYYEGWNPSARGRSIEDAPALLDRLRRELRENLELPDAKHVVKAVLTVMDRYISAGEIDKVISELPAGMQEFWRGDTGAQE